MSRRPPPCRPGQALFLDLDGTLLEIAQTPDAVRVPEGLRRTLAALNERLAGAVALVSGRPLEDIDRLFGPLRLAAAGVHGAERRDAAGQVHRVPTDAGLDRVRAALAQFVTQHPLALLEDKGASVALHYRRAPALEPAARAAADAALAGLDGALQRLDGKQVVEIAPRATSKGDAIGQFMGEEPFAGRIPVFVGDDRTDESGFAVVNHLGGYSVKVGGRGRSHARWRLADVGDVLAWLESCTA